MYLSQYGLFYLPCFRRSNFHRQSSLASTTRERSWWPKRNYVGEKWSINFAEKSTSTKRLGIFYIPQINDMGPTVLLPFRRKARWGFFRPEKSDGFGRVWTRELGPPFISSKRKFCMCIVCLRKFQTYLDNTRFTTRTIALSVPSRTSVCFSKTNTQ
jgi:hypothetical protein